MPIPATTLPVVPFGNNANALQKAGPTLRHDLYARDNLDKLVEGFRDDKQQEGQQGQQQQHHLPFDDMFSVDDDSMGSSDPFGSGDSVTMISSSNKSHISSSAKSFSSNKSFSLTSKFHHHQGSQLPSSDKSCISETPSHTTRWSSASGVVRTRNINSMTEQMARMDNSPASKSLYVLAGSSVCRGGGTRRRRRRPQPNADIIFHPPEELITNEEPQQQQQQQQQEHEIFFDPQEIEQQKPQRSRAPQEPTFAPDVRHHQEQPRASVNPALCELFTPTARPTKPATSAVAMTANSARQVRPHGPHKEQGLPYPQTHQKQRTRQHRASTGAPNQQPSSTSAPPSRQLKSMIGATQQRRHKPRQRRTSMGAAGPPVTSTATRKTRHSASKGPPQRSVSAGGAPRPQLQVVSAEDPLVRHSSHQMRPNHEIEFSPPDAGFWNGCKPSSSLEKNQRNPPHQGQQQHGRDNLFAHSNHYDYSSASTSMKQSHRRPSGGFHTDSSSGTQQPRRRAPPQRRASTGGGGVGFPRIASASTHSQSSRRSGNKGCGGNHQSKPKAHRRASAGGLTTASSRQCSSHCRGEIKSASSSRVAAPKGQRRPSGNPARSSSSSSSTTNPTPRLRRATDYDENDRHRGPAASAFAGKNKQARRRPSTSTSQSCHNHNNNNNNNHSSITRRNQTDRTARGIPRPKSANNLTSLSSSADHTSNSMRRYQTERVVARNIPPRSNSADSLDEVASFQ